MERIKHLLKPVLKATYQPLMRLTRGMTLGVRGAVFDTKGRILLVRHTYAPGWAFPGGGVEYGETLLDALLRELKEEAGIVPEGAPRLHGVYANFAAFPGDHVALFVVTRWTQPERPKGGLEIAACRFFEREGLPADVTGGTRRRLAELYDREPAMETW